MKEEESRGFQPFLGFAQFSPFSKFRPVSGFAESCIKKPCWRCDCHLKERDSRIVSASVWEDNSISMVVMRYEL